MCDLLATEGLSKIRTCMDLLVEYGYVEPKKNLRETYESVLGIYNLDRDTPEMWEMVWNNQIIALFQLEQQSGISGIQLTKPKSVEDLATLNSVIRLMSAGKGQEQPIEKFARFREHPEAWEEEMNSYELSEEEKAILHEILDYSYGISAQQEDLYNLMTHPKIAGFSLGEADVLRKAVAKKNPLDFNKFEEKFFNNMRKKDLSYNLCRYVWEQLVRPQSGYSFNLSHCLSYSLVALQEMNLAYHYPILFWNTANLIIDSGGVYEVSYKDDEDETTLESNKLIQNNKINYGKVASAIGRMQKYNVKVLPPDINESGYTFTPNVKNNSIRYGLTGITRVGQSIVDEIIQGRPYESFSDFNNRIKTNKTQMINLIKCGAFDSFEDRRVIMKEYLISISNTKKTVNLRNANMLIQKGLIPDELSFEKKVFNFNKYIKRREFKNGNNLILNERAFPFYEKNFDLDDLIIEEDIVQINSSKWKSKYYDKYMNAVRNYIKKNHDFLLDELNKRLIKEVKDKYASGTLEKWSMDSVSFYQEKHELADVDLKSYGISNFSDFSIEPAVDRRFFTRDGKEITMYKLGQIAGTVLDRDKNKNLITLLTTEGVVDVKAYGVMPAYDKQISVQNPNGTKTIVERSWFTRGNKIIVGGMRRGVNMFIAKKYKNSPFKHHFQLIKEVTPDNKLIIQEERYEVS